jgi:Mg2+-importing ATPase
VSVGTGPQPEFWQRRIADVLADLGTGERGLDGAEAARRLAEHGANVLRERQGRAFILQFLSRFGNPLVVLLLAAATISALTGDRPSFLLISVIVVLSVTLDSVQEFRAGRAAERLRGSVALRTRAWRDGRPGELDAAALVPGDVVELDAGRLVPADGRVLEARDCYVHQALLTGEPYPAEKHPADLDPATEAGAASNALFMGTSVLSGSVRMLVCRTGGETALGAISRTLTTRPPATAFESGMRGFGLFILRLAVLMVLFVLLVNALFHRPWLESFLFAVALSVGLTPELLPMVVSVTLARGAMRMAGERVIVKRLGAVHDLGAMDVLCTDKTGTLTEAEIRLERHLDPLGQESDRTLMLAYLNSVFESGITSPLDAAILRHGEVDVSGWHKVDEVQFDFERRRVSILADDGTQRLLVLKGAFAETLACCTRSESGPAGAITDLDEAARGRLGALFEQLSSQGFRVLGIAWKETPRGQDHARIDDESALVFAGFAAFEDPPKASSREAIEALTRGGVAVKIVTGDNELVTRHLCDELGLPVTGLLTGPEIAALSDPALATRALDANLFCRVTPPQKSRVIQALRGRGRVVGYLGDGINDAPSLHAADVGISVEGAVDVAREAADLILLDHDLGVVERGVREGRRTFGNILKYLMMGTSSNFGNMLSMAAGTLVLPFLPLLPVQILLNNLLYDLSEVPLPLDAVDAVDVAQPRQWDIGFLRRFMLVFGPVSSLFDFATFYILLRVFHADQMLFHSGWFVESLATQVLVVFVIRTRVAPWRSRPAPALVWTALAVVALAAVLPFTGFGRALGMVPLPAPFFGFLAAMVVVYLFVVDAAKRWFYRRYGRMLAPAPARSAAVA